MTEVHVVRHDNSHRYRKELDQYFRGRYDVFVREQGWKDLERPDGRDIDQFDTEDAIHLLAIEGSQVIGGFRFNPSTGPTLLNQVFPELSLMPLVGIAGCLRNHPAVGGQRETRSMFASRCQFSVNGRVPGTCARAEAEKITIHV